MGKMDADLVGPSCFQHASEETRNRRSVRAGKMLKDLPVGNGGTPIFANGLLVARMGMPADRGLDRALRAVRCAPDKCEIAASKRPLGFFGELPGETAVCLVGLGNHHQASGVFIDAVQDAGTLQPHDSSCAACAGQSDLLDAI